MPRPPCSFGQHTLSQLNFLFSSSPPPQRKFLWIEMIFCSTICEILKKDKKKIDKDVNMEFIKQTLRTKDKVLCFHGASFFLSLRMMGFQVSFLLWLAPMEIPEYVKGRGRRQQFRILENLLLPHFSPLIKPQNNF